MGRQVMTATGDVCRAMNLVLPLDVFEAIQDARNARGSSYAEVVTDLVRRILADSSAVASVNALH